MPSCSPCRVRRVSSEPREPRAARNVPVLGRRYDHAARSEVQQPAKPPAAPHAARPSITGVHSDESNCRDPDDPLAMIVLDELRDCVRKCRSPIGMIRSRHSS